MTPAERYNALRTRLAGLGVPVDGWSLQQMLRAVDDLWRDMLAVRAQLVRDAGDTRATSDFYVFVRMLYPGHDGDGICRDCRAWVASHHRACQYCGSTGAPKQPAPATGAAAVASAPQPEGVRYPPPKLLHGAGPAPAPPPTWKTVNERLTAMQRYVRRAALASYFPFSPEELARRSVNDLRAIGRLCQGWDDAGLKQGTRKELVVWILGHQPQEPVAAGAPPFGSLPDLTDLEEARRGASR